MNTLNEVGQAYVLAEISRVCKTDDPKAACVGDPNYGRGWFDDAEDAADRGDYQFEVGPFYTRSGNPVSVDVDPDHFRKEKDEEEEETE